MNNKKTKQDAMGKLWWWMTAIIKKSSLIDLIDSLFGMVFLKDYKANNNDSK